MLILLCMDNPGDRETINHLISTDVLDDTLMAQIKEGLTQLSRTENYGATAQISFVVARANEPIPDASRN